MLPIVWDSAEDSNGVVAIVDAHAKPNEAGEQIAMEFESPPNVDNNMWWMDLRRARSLRNALSHAIDEIERSKSAQNAHSRRSEPRHRPTGD